MLFSDKKSFRVEIRFNFYQKISPYILMHAMVIIFELALFRFAPAVTSGMTNSEPGNCIVFDLLGMPLS